MSGPGAGCFGTLADGPGSPASMAAYLRSCGYQPGRLMPVGAGWLRAEVASRSTGEALGARWIRRRPGGGGYEVRSTAP